MEGKALYMWRKHQNYASGGALKRQTASETSKLWETKVFRRCRDKDRPRDDEHDIILLGTERLWEGQALYRG